MFLPASFSLFIYIIYRNVEKIWNRNHAVLSCNKLYAIKKKNADNANLLFNSDT